MNTNKTIMVGRTGIYELDDDIIITNMYFIQPSNYIKDEAESEAKKQEGESAIKKAKNVLDTALNELGSEPKDTTSEAYATYWNNYSTIINNYITAVQKGKATLDQGINGVYKPDETNPLGDLENVIIDFIYDIE